MATLKQQFEAAKTHIDAKRYTEARKILNSIDHPKAAEWLERIDNLSPKPAARKATNRNTLLIALGTGVLAFLLGIGVSRLLFADTPKAEAAAPTVIQPELCDFADWYEQGATYRTNFFNAIGDNNASALLESMSGYVELAPPDCKIASDIYTATGEGMLDYADAISNGSQSGMQAAILKIGTAFGMYGGYLQAESDMLDFVISHASAN